MSPVHRKRWLPLLLALALLALATAAAITRHHRTRPAHPASVTLAAPTARHTPSAAPTPLPPAPEPRATPSPPRPTVSRPATASAAPTAPPTAEARVEAERDASQAANRDYTRRATTSSGSAQDYARSLMSSPNFSCFSAVVERESGWSVTAQNPSSGAYGLMQALPGSKMASAGPDWKTSAATQIRWGLGYMNSRYGSPCGAWSFWQAHGWY
ncbi:transglycosylase SLT domain-containing protein [Streptomyces sp. CBMA29]|uniref:aggregation-promoting factor C-terminal-like domain-containing protein n=1 Tax=Streptomyces sp. CBMA29 TaxID=1896314 RepID=UPI002948C16E|nr:transglycosylase SLT domain-containing protein [Streptomyces sp. CBMA29]